MIIVIDAYNYIKSISSDRFVDESVVNRWIATFQNYVALRGNKVVLVFDAGPSFYPTTENHGDVQVLYAGQRQTADDVLKIWVERHATQDILLVTSDRQIRDHAQNFQVVSMSSQDFHKIFSNVIKQEHTREQVMQQTIHKTKTDESDDQSLDRLMEQGSRGLVAASHKNEYDTVVRVRNGTKASKADKQAMKKIDKI